MASGIKKLTEQEDKWIAGGIRWSQEEQGKGETKKRQTDTIEGYVAINYPEYKDRIKWYIDDGVSGDFFKRPAIREMIADAKAGKLKAIVYEIYGRCARTLGTALKIIEEFEERAGIPVIIADGVNPKDEDDIFGVFARQMGFSVAELEKKLIVKRLKSGRKIKNKRGVYAGGPMPSHGYYRDPKKDPYDKSDRIIKTNQEIKAIFQEIYNWIMNEKLSLPKCCERLNENNVLPPGKAKKWKAYILSRTLSNRALKGEFYANRWLSKQVEGDDGRPKIIRLGEKPRSEWAKIPIEDPIFTEEQFDNLRKALSSRTRRGRKRNAKTNEDFLIDKGLIKCGVCGSYIRPYNDSTGYYICPWRIAPKHILKENNREKCTLPYLKKDYLNTFIWDEIVESILFNEATLKKFLDVDGLQKDIDRILKEREIKETEVEKLTRRKKRWYNLFGDEVIEEEELKIKIAEAEDKIQTVQKDINRLREKEQWLKDSRLDSELFQEAYDTLRTMATPEVLRQLTAEEKQSIVRGFIKGLNMKLVPSTDREAWFTLTGKVGVELKWEGRLTVDNIVDILGKMDKKFLEDFNLVPSRFSEFSLISKQLTEDIGGKLNKNGELAYINNDAVNFD